MRISDWSSDVCSSDLRVLATPDRLDLRSDCRFGEGARETILANWDDDAAANNLNILYNAEVVEVSGAKGAFHIKTATGETIAAETIVLAIGTQGNPNRLRCPGNELPRSEEHTYERP